MIRARFLNLVPWGVANVSPGFLNLIPWAVVNVSTKNKNHEQENINKINIIYKQIHRRNIITDLKS